MQWYTDKMWSNRCDLYAMVYWQDVIKHFFFVENKEDEEDVEVKEEVKVPHSIMDMEGAMTVEVVEVVEMKKGPKMKVKKG